MMLCRSWRSRRWTRQQKQMQEKAMVEARAAGWNAYQEEGDESSIEGEFDLENDEEHTASNSWSHNKSQSYDCPTDEEGSISGSADSQLGLLTPANNSAKATSEQESAPREYSSPPKKASSYALNDNSAWETRCTTDEAEMPTPKKSNKKSSSTSITKPVNIHVKSFASMKMFTPDYFEKQQGEARVRTTPTTAQTANMSFSDDDEESEMDSTAGDDDTALDSAKHLDQILHDLQVQQVSPPVSTGNSSAPPYATYRASPQRGYSDFSPRLNRNDDLSSDDDLDEVMNSYTQEAANHDASVSEFAEHRAAVSVAFSEDVTESTADVTLTETMDHNISDSTGVTENILADTESAPAAEVTSAVTVETIPDSQGLTKYDHLQRHSSSVSSTPTDEKCDESDDDDSLDLGVSLSVWPSQKQHQASRISTLARGIFSPSELMASAADETDGAESMDDDDDASLTQPPFITHDGADVFLATEGARYGKMPNPASYIEPTSTNDKDGAGHSNGMDLEHLGNNNIFQLFQEAPSPQSNHLRGSSAPSLNFDPADSNVDDDLDFQPRYHDNPEDENTGEQTVDHETDLTGEQELSMKAEHADYSRHATPAKSTNVCGSCFGGMTFVSPKLFEKDNDETERTSADKVAVSAEKTTTPASLTSPLASMVHPIDLRLFELSNMASAERSFSALDDTSVDNDSVASCPVLRSPTSVFLSDKKSYFAKTELKNRRSHLSASFKSSTKSNRVAYRLNSGKKSMSNTDRIYSKALLPNKPVLDHAEIAKSNATVVASSRQVHDGTLSILLVDMSQKIFEIVSVDIQRDTTVGDVLAKARALATDPSLSEQKYVSICYGIQEFGAPMLPVSLLIDWEKHKTRPLVVAVPMGHSASEMQAVKRVLSRHPKIKRWWKQQDPFRPMPKELKEEKTNIASETPAAIELHSGKTTPEVAEAFIDNADFFEIESLSI